MKPRKISYTVKVYRHTELSDKVSGALDRMFEELNKPRLAIVESVAALSSDKPLSKSEISKMEKAMLPMAKKTYAPDTISKVEIVRNEEVKI